MEENKEIEIIKPEFSGEIQAKIKSVGEIESNIKEVKGYVENLNNYYKNVAFTEETMKEAKEEKSKVNKFKKQVADYRRNIVAEYNKPIKTFEDIAKETENLLTDTYNTINEQVANYENKQKEAKEKEVKEYFEEYKTANNIDFIEYVQAKINVTLTASMKSLKEQAKQFIDKIADDLKLIETQEHKAEILVEYKQTLNVSNAITTVMNRFKAVEEEKRKQEEQVVHIQMNENHEITKQSHEELEKAFNREMRETQINQKTYTITFKVTETAPRLKQLKDYLIREGYQYE